MRVNQPAWQWMRLYSEAWFLAYETSIVVFLRMNKLALGGKAAETEARRMVEEKVAATVSLQLRAITGGLGQTVDEVSGKTLSHYRKKVRANRRRLTRPTK
jgi:hypothetical protein